VKALGLTGPGTVGAFTDVTPGDWFHDPVTVAAGAGLVLGVGEGRFAPNALISREEMAVIIARALGNRVPAGDGTELTSFVDRESLSDWAIPGMEAAARAGIVGGDDLHRLAPRANATRAEAVAMVQRMLAVLAE
jgi:hypothetical protein